MKKSTQFSFYNLPIPEIMLEKGIEFLYFSDYPTGNFFLHKHNFIEIMYITSGDIAVSVEGQKYPINVSDLVIIPPSLTHNTLIENSARKYDRFVIHLSPMYLNQLLKLFNLDPNQFDFFHCVNVISCSTDLSMSLKYLFQRMYYYQAQNTSTGNSFVQTGVLELAIEIYSLIFEKKQKTVPLTNPSVDFVIDYIQKHYSDPTLSLEMVTSAAYLSTGYLSRLFKAYTGVSIYQYITHKRLEYSCDLISEGSSILNACLQCGFTDYTAYLKAFKKAFQLTPQQFKNALHQGCHL